MRPVNGPTSIPIFVSTAYRCLCPLSHCHRAGARSRLAQNEAPRAGAPTHVVGTVTGQSSSFAHGLFVPGSSCGIGAAWGGAAAELSVALLGLEDPQDKRPTQAESIRSPPSARPMARRFFDLPAGMKAGTCSRRSVSEVFSEAATGGGGPAVAAEGNGFEAVGSTGALDAGGGVGVEAAADGSG